MNTTETEDGAPEAPTPVGALIYDGEDYWFDPTVTAEMIASQTVATLFRSLQ